MSSTLHHQVLWSCSICSSMSILLSCTHLHHQFHPEGNWQPKQTQSCPQSSCWLVQSFQQSEPQHHHEDPCCSQSSPLCTGFWGLSSAIWLIGRWFSGLGTAAPTLDVCLEDVLKEHWLVSYCTFYTSIQLDFLEKSLYKSATQSTSTGRTLGLSQTFSPTTYHSLSHSTRQNTWMMPPCKKLSTSLHLLQPSLTDLVLSPGGNQVERCSQTRILSCNLKLTLWNLLVINVKWFWTLKRQN